MTPRPTSDLTDLVLHVLAHVPLGAPGCVHDARYLQWARGRAPAELEALLHEDAAALARAWAGGCMPAAVHAWPELFASLDELRACAALELRAIAPERVRAPWVLARLVAHEQPELELLHATLCALGPWFAGWRAAEVEPRLLQVAPQVERWLEPAARVVPSLAGARIELSWVLGPRGRGLPSRLVVGAPAPWHDLDACTSAVLAMHEQAVKDAGDDRYAQAEWAALTGLAARMGAAPLALRQAHARWVASLELEPLLASLHAEGQLTLEQRRALLHDREQRVPRLAALAAAP